MLFLRKIILVLAAATLISCATKTQIVNRWVDASAPGRDIGKTMVIAITKDEPARRSLESAYATALKERGIDAVASFFSFPHEKQINKENVRPVVKQKGIKSVLVTLFKGVEKEKVYHPPTYSYAPAPYYGSPWGYYGHMYPMVSSPGYYATYAVILLESNLYDVESEKLIWTVSTKTEDPGTQLDLINSKVRAVMKELSRVDLLPKKK